MVKVSSCPVCGHIVSFTTSQQIGYFMDFNCRSVLAVREIGCGRACPETFCCNMPHVAAVSVRSHVTSVHKSIRAKWFESMHKTRLLVIKSLRSIWRKLLTLVSPACHLPWLLPHNVLSLSLQDYKFHIRIAQFVLV